jgi:transcription elongation factor GreB
MVRREAVPGAENYMTPFGVSYFREQIEELQSKKRDLAKQNIPESDFRFKEISRRVHELEYKLLGAVVVDPLANESDEIRFGATVTVENQEGELKTYSLVGAHESDVKSGKISWASPIGKSLLRAHTGDVVKVNTPTGADELEVKKIEYVPIVFQ